MGRPGLVKRRNYLHGRNLQEGREADLRKGSVPEGSVGLFNSSLEGNTRRAIDFHEGERINEKALKLLIRAAASLNKSAKS